MQKLPIYNSMTAREPFIIDSVVVTFASLNFSDFPGVGVRASSTSGGLSPTTIQRENQGQAEIVFQNLANFFGRATNTVDLWFQLDGGDPSANFNRTVTLMVDITLHTPNSLIVEQSYAGEATFSLVIEPTGYIFVSD